jgi:Ca-activated chloride channel family protein
MPKKTSPKSPARRLRRSLRRSLGSGGGGRALGVLAAVAVATAGIVLSTGTTGAAPIPSGPIANTPGGTPAAPAPGTLTFQQGPISGSAALAQSGIVVGAPQQVLVDIDLKATGEGSNQRIPVAMTLVLDRSGSMSGQKLEQARRSVLQALEQMQDGDWFGFVAYDHSAQTLVPLQPVGPNRASIRATINNVRAGGGTQIPQGLDQGFQTLQSAPAGYARRVVLVSDGIDGSGVGPQGIRNSVTRYGQSGVTVAALGIGTDYDEAFLTAVADAGNGAYAYLQHGSELQGFLAQEMRAASAMVAERVAFDFALPPNTRFVRAFGATANSRSGGVQLQVGNMAAGDQRHIVLELQSTATATGPLGGIGVDLSFTDRGTGQLASAHAGALQIAGVSDQALAAATRNDEAFANAKAVLIEEQQQEAMNEWRQGNVEGAVRMARDNAAVLDDLRQMAPTSMAVSAAAEAAEEDAESFEALDPMSAGGRGYGLGSNAARRSRATGL